MNFSFKNLLFIFLILLLHFFASKIIFFYFHAPLLGGTDQRQVPQAGVQHGGDSVFEAQVVGGPLEKARASGTADGHPLCAAAEKLLLLVLEQMLVGFELLERLKKFSRAFGAGEGAGDGGDGREVAQVRAAARLLGPRPRAAGRLGERGGREVVNQCVPLGQYLIIFFNFIVSILANF
jgi:hypothetical protein